MAQDLLENTKNTCSFEPSFPLFNLELLKRANFEADISNLIPIEQVCQAIEAKNLHKINLNGDFSLFTPAPKKKAKKATQKTSSSHYRGMHLKGSAQPISLPQNKVILSKTIYLT